MGLGRAFSDSFSLQRVFEKLRLRDGLVRTVRQTGRQTGEITCGRTLLVVFRILASLLSCKTFKM